MYSRYVKVLHFCKENLISYILPYKEVLLEIIIVDCYIHSVILLGIHSSISCIFGFPPCRSEEDLYGLKHLMYKLSYVVSCWRRAGTPLYRAHCDIFVHCTCHLSLFWVSRRIFSLVDLVFLHDKMLPCENNKLNKAGL